MPLKLLHKHVIKNLFGVFTKKTVENHAKKIPKESLETTETKAYVPAGLTFPCPRCSQPIKLMVEKGGKERPCPHCRKTIQMPSV